jgi:hypothetical protein
MLLHLLSSMRPLLLTQFHARNSPAPFPPPCCRPIMVNGHAAPKPAMAAAVETIFSDPAPEPAAAVAAAAEVTIPEAEATIPEPPSNNIVATSPQLKEAVKEAKANAASSAAAPAAAGSGSAKKEEAPKKGGLFGMFWGKK